MPTREDAATNRVYSSGLERVAEVTLYDAESIDVAQAFIAGIDTALRCPDKSAERLSFEVIDVAAATRCDDIRAVRTFQPVSEAIDAWCRIGNFIAWVRLDPSGAIAAVTNPSAPTPVAPTDEHAVQTLVIVVADRLHAAWDTAG